MSPLVALMRTRLNRYLEGELEAPQDIIELLQRKESEETTVADQVAVTFERQVRIIVQALVDPLLRDSVFDRAQLLVDLWPLDPIFSIQLFGSGDEFLTGLTTSDSVGSLPSTMASLQNWPIGADPVDVFKWMASKSPLSEEEITLLHSSKAYLAIGDLLKTQKLDPNNTNRGSMLESIYLDCIAAQTPIVAPNACAVVFLVEKQCKEILAESSLAAFQFTSRTLALLTRDQPDAKEIRTQIVTDALREEAPDFVTNEYAISQLERELRLRIDNLRSKLKFDESYLTTHQQTVAEEDGIFLYDARFASYVESLGATGKALADQVRESAKKRMIAYQDGAPAGSLWVLWADPNTAPIGCRFARALAQVLWLDVVHARVRKPVALTMAVHEPVTGLFSRIQIEEEHNGQRKIILPDQTLMRLQDTASLGADTINALMVGRGLKLFGSITSHRVLRFQIFKAHEQALCNNPDPRVIHIDGGYSALAHDLLGMKGKKAADQVRDIIEAEHACEIPLPPESTFSRLLIRTFLPARGQRQAHLTLVLGTALLPDYVYELQKAFGKSRDLRRARKLVPVLDLPPFVGKRSNEHGPQATLSMILISYMRDNARQFIEKGGVQIDTDTFIALAQKSGLPTSMVNAVRDRWKQDGDDGPALLNEVGKDRYTLGKAHSLAQTFLEEGARKEIEGEAAGKRGVHNRRAKIKRLSRLKSR